MPLRTVAIAVTEYAPVFETAVGCEVFGIDRTAMGVPRFDVKVCSVSGGSVRTSAGFRIVTRFGLGSLASADLVIVPGWHDFDAVPPRPLLRALRRARDAGAKIASFCSGSFVLAEAGLLNGRATTHWMYVDALRSRFPSIEWDDSVLYIDDGSGVYTSAGTAAAIDLCLHLVRKDFGAGIANVIARRMVVPPHREGGQAQFVESPVPTVEGDDGIARALNYALAHLAEDLPVERLARRANMSPRTFARRFKSATGTTPLVWINGQRVMAAQRLLESTELPVEAIAHRVGFDSAAGLRVHFTRRLATSPNDYRRTFAMPASARTAAL